MAIRVLESQVISRIAAGEVVERPASVVKELLENSLDAGATRVSVEVQGGGVQSIRVVDNGTGISAEEAKVAFERHATSKLQDFSDLENIATLGFRGEALPSIAAVADVVLLSRTPDSEAGVLVEVKDGEVIRNLPQGCSPGTSVTVRHLFRHVPARLKFLRSTATENGYIQDLVARFILAYPHVAFTLELDGRRSLISPGTDDLREAIAAVYRPDVASALLEIEVVEAEGARCVVSGFVSPPSLSRANRNAISFFVNGRWIQNRNLTFAVVEAYQNLLPERRSPLAVLYISVFAEDVDVNVHPTKREVRFRREHEVFASVQRAVRATVVGAAPVPAVQVGSGGQYNNFSSPKPFVTPSSPRPAEVQRAMDLLPPHEHEPVGTTPHQTLPILRVLGQVQTTYVVAEGPDGMYLIDQHAGHERVMFERVRDQALVGDVERQGLLEPVAVELSPLLEDALRTYEGELAHYGFQVESFGHGACLVRAVPATASQSDPAQSLIEVLEALRDGESSPEAREWRLAATVACHSSVRAGQALTVAEMTELVRLLEAAREPHTCPHGRPTIMHLSTAILERGFGRR